MLYIMTKVCIFNKSNDNWKIVQLSADTLCVRPPKSCTTLTLTLTLTLTPLTLQNENPHTGYPCHGNIHTDSSACMKAHYEQM